MADESRRRRAQQHRLDRLRARAPTPPVGAATSPKKVAVNFGWGRLIMAHTFDDVASLANSLRAEQADQRDIAFYVHEPHVLLAHAPQELFLDPSDSYRLDLATYRPARDRRRGFTVRRLSDAATAQEVNRLYLARDMAPTPTRFMIEERDPRSMPIFVAIDDAGNVIGAVTGLDHVEAFGDPNQATSLWSLVVAPDAKQAGIGEDLVRRVAELFIARGRQTLDLSVMHDNRQAIALYEKVGFQRVPFFTVKRKNSRNEKLFVGPTPEQALNPYARIVIDEARRRGVHATIIDAEGGFFELSYGGRRVRCRESLSELTSAVAMSICDDKSITRRIVSRADVAVAEQIVAAEEDAMANFLEKHGSVVVKPARGEQGRGIAVDVRDMDQLRDAVANAGSFCDIVLLEEYIEGQDLRVIVIADQVVAASVRKPPEIVGDGVTSAIDLIAAQSRRRRAATDGESSIPIDVETERCLVEAGFRLTDLLPAGRTVTVRKTANLHTGGTMHDVTAVTHPDLKEAAIRATRAIGIPLAGIDFIVRSADQPEYRFIEANERPGLANHEPQPTAERYLDLLFPLTKSGAH